MPVTSTWATDPGEHRHAVASGFNRELVDVRFVPTNVNLTYAPNAIVVEQMRIYPDSYKSLQELTRKANDLLRVEGAARDLIAAARAVNPHLLVQRYTAPEWKSQLHKIVHHNRIWDVLTHAERETFARCISKTVAFVEEKVRGAAKTRAFKGRAPYSWEAHNLLDAVGLLLFYYRRIDKAGMPK